MKAAQTPTRNSGTPMARAADTRRTLTVLVVDDPAADTRPKILALDGCRVLTAHGGSQALALAAADPRTWPSSIWPRPGWTGSRSRANSGAAPPLRSWSR